MVRPLRERMAEWLEGSGIEIGALHSPLPVRRARVRYVDRFTVPELRRHYPELDGVDLVPVDIVGSAYDLTAVGPASQDFVIANHLIEHLDDPIRGLREMTRVLRPGGLLYVALPDPRQTFDRRRPVTPVEHMVQEFRDGTDRTRAGHYREWVDLVEGHAGDSAEQRVADLMAMDYSIHFHVFTPTTWLELLAAARREAGVELELVAFETTSDDAHREFISILAREGGDPPRRGADVFTRLADKARSLLRRPSRRRLLTRPERSEAPRVARSRRGRRGETLGVP